ncbi:MAG: hypothetical protein WEB02_06525 [Methylophaga sp.]
MSNFKDAFQSGIKEAKIAQSNIKEITSIFDDFNIDIHDASNKVIDLEIRQQYDSQQDSPFNRGIASLVRDFTNIGRYYEAIMASNSIKDNVEPIELCEWKIGVKGYPVKLSYEGLSESCEDKVSLISALEDLLRHPATGRKLNSLIEKSN